MLARYSSCYPRVRPHARAKAGQRFPVPGYSAAPARKVPPFFLPVQVFATGARWRLLPLLRPLQMRLNWGAALRAHLKYPIAVCIVRPSR